MKHTTFLKASAFVMLFAFCPSVEAKKHNGHNDRPCQALTDCSVCTDGKCNGCKINFASRDHEIARNLVVKDNLTVCGDECITGNLKVRGCIISGGKTDCPQCNCCFDDEIQFNAQDMHRIFSRDISREWMFLPDAQCTFPPLFTLVPGWSLNFGLMNQETTEFELQVPFNPVAMEFEVPKDLCNKRNIEIDLHLFAKRGVLPPPTPKVNGNSKLPKEFARLVLIGSFAGECQALRPKLCAQKVVEVCQLIDDNNNLPNPELLRPVEPCKHFKVTYCLDAKKINPCDLGQLLIVRAPLRLTQTIQEKEWLNFRGELILTAVSIRYRKKEGDKRECRPSKKCEFFKEFPNWPKEKETE